jgi:hypothetical protein
MVGLRHRAMVMHWIEDIVDTLDVVELSLMKT